MLLKSRTFKKPLSNIVAFSLSCLFFSGLLSGEINKNEVTTTQFKYSESTLQASNSMPARAARAVDPDLIAPGSDIGMWVWHRDYLVDAWERILMLEFCKTHGITRIFVQVHFDHTVDGRYELAHKKDWKELLSTANLLGIKVEALDGCKEMGFEINRSDTLDRLRAVLDFHTAQPKNASFSGIHYDIEPYNTERWKVGGEHQEIALEFLETMVEVRKLMFTADPSLTLANDIPFWYDSDNKYIIDFKGSRKFFNEHIQDISDFIGIMSYRTEMIGVNSVSEITSGELAYGDKIDRPVYLSLETVSLPETPQITFFGRTPEEVALAVRQLIEARKVDASFGGVFLHEYQALRTMGKQWNLSALN